MGANPYRWKRSNLVGGRRLCLGSVAGSCRRRCCHRDRVLHLLLHCCCCRWVLPGRFRTRRRLCLLWCCSTCTRILPCTHGLQRSFPRGGHVEGLGWGEDRGGGGGGGGLIVLLLALVIPLVLLQLLVVLVPLSLLRDGRVGGRRQFPLVSSTGGVWVREMGGD